MNTIEEDWTDLWSKCHPHGASPVQTEECYKMFLAGIACTHRFLEDVSTLEEAVGAAKLEEHRDELCMLVAQFLPKGGEPYATR